MMQKGDVRDASALVVFEEQHYDQRRQALDAIRAREVQADRRVREGD